VAHSHFCTATFQINPLAGTSDLGASKTPLRPTACYLMDTTRRFTRRDRHQGWESDHSHLVRAKNERGWKSTPPYDFMAWTEPTLSSLSPLFPSRIFIKSDRPTV
jgi:hypothetical protein